MDHFPFVYQILVCSYDCDKGQTLRHRCAGVGFAENYTDALRQIEEKEGDDLECIEHLELIGDGDQNIIDIDPKWVPALIHDEDLFWGEDLSNPPSNLGLRRAGRIATEVHAKSYFQKKGKKNEP